MARCTPPTTLRLLALAALAVGCRSAAVPRAATPEGARERAQFEQVLRDLGRQKGAAGLDLAVLEAQGARYAEVVAWHDAGELQSAAQNFWAGATLVRSDEPQHLVLAESLGGRATALGEPRGGLVRAEARDRLALLLGEPQPYGTQSVYVPITGRWRLYEVDPRTTDAERAELGLPPLEELRRRAEARNDSDLTKRLGGELVRPGNLPR